MKEMGSAVRYGWKNGEVYDIKVKGHSDTPLHVFIYLVYVVIVDNEKTALKSI